MIRAEKRIDDMVLLPCHLLITQYNNHSEAYLDVDPWI